MAGKISRQVKSTKPFLVNGRWVHPTFDMRPPSPTLLAKFHEIAHRLRTISA